MLKQRRAMIEDFCNLYKIDLKALYKLALLRQFTIVTIQWCCPAESSGYQNFKSPENKNGEIAIRQTPRYLSYKFLSGEIIFHFIKKASFTFTGLRLKIWHFPDLFQHNPLVVR